MSLYQIESMMRSFKKLDKDAQVGRPMTDAEFDAAKDKIRLMNLPDVRI